MLLTKKKKCERILTDGKYRGQQCPLNASAGQAYCYKHKNLPNKPVSEIKKKSSIFLITVNSNEQFTKMKPERVKLFKQMIKFISSEEELRKNFIKIQMGGKDCIKNIEIKRTFESSTKDLLHAHVYIDIDHCGFITMKLAYLRGFINKMWGKAVHLNINSSSNNAKILADYVSKQELKL